VVEAIPVATAAERVHEHVRFRKASQPLGAVVTTG